MPEPQQPPSCSLDRAAVAAQLERYRRAGAGGRLLERSPRALMVELAAGTDSALVEQAIAIERECCPFYEFAWDPATRRLSISVTQREHEPALGAIARAIGLKR
ncbi:MAG TPA: hypothetical protein VGG41_10245 [Solirubrobacteraceae bacterium]|jgi:hypothetical protein